MLWLKGNFGSCESKAKFKIKCAQKRRTRLLEEKGEEKSEKKGKKREREENHGASVRGEFFSSFKLFK